MKKRGPLLAAFCIPLLITLIICVNREIYPFGDQCMLHIDMYHQYCPFFTELMEKLKTGGSTFYSWNIGLGADFVSLYAYYLASPLNWLLILWPRGYVIEFMTALSILKIALAVLHLPIIWESIFLCGRMPEMRRQSYGQRRRRQCGFRQMWHPMRRLYAARRMRCARLWRHMPGI